MVLKVLNSPVRLNRKVKLDLLSQPPCRSKYKIVFDSLSIVVQVYDILLLNPFIVHEGASSAGTHPSLHLPHLLLVPLDQ